MPTPMKSRLALHGCSAGFESTGEEAHRIHVRAGALSAAAGSLPTICSRALTPDRARAKANRGGSRSSSASRIRRQWGAATSRTCRCDLGH